MKKYLILVLCLFLLVFISNVNAGYSDISTQSFGTSADVTSAPSSPSSTSSGNDTFIVVYQPSSNIMGVVGLMGLIAIPFIAYIWDKKRKDE